MNYPPVVIQGTTDLCKEVVEYYKDFKCIFSTWNSEPKENLDYLSSCKNVVLITDDLPTKKWEHHWGLYQFKSTLNGFNYLKENGYDFGIKVRSDLMLNIPQVVELIDFKKFNCFGWHDWSVGYFCDFYFAGPVSVICDAMKKCIDLSPESHAENTITYVILNEIKFREINYTLNDELEFYCPKHNLTSKKYMDHVREGIWFNTTNVKQTSRYVNDYVYSKDNFPDNYRLTYKDGPPLYF